MKIFLDSANPLETAAADRLLKEKGLPGVVGQTTNPTLLKKVVHASEHLRKKTLTHEHVVAIYRDTVRTISRDMKGPLSVQVIVRPETTVESMLSQARMYKEWAPNVVVKFPCTKHGLAAAEIFSKEGPVNITLVFTQEQAAAAHAATKNRGFGPDGNPYDVFISAFIGRLDDAGFDGTDMMANIKAMYHKFESHVMLLASSIRSVAHLMYCQKLDVTATVPLHIIDEWVEAGCPKPDENYIYQLHNHTEMPFRELILDDPWNSYDISSELTDVGVKTFYDDWEAIIAAG